MSCTPSMVTISNVVDLKPYKTMWRVRVSVVRLWTQYSVAGGVTIELILVDSNGDKIHASVKKELVSQFDRLLTQGSTITLTNFSLNHSCGSYRTTNHLYKISFLSSTRVRLCEDLLSVNAFAPVTFKDVLDGTLNPDFLVDIIGHVVEVSQVEIISVNGKETEKISIELRDVEDVRLPVVLWGKFATDVGHAIRDGGEKPVILVLWFGKIKMWKDERSVSNAYNVSVVHVNPDMAEVEKFRSMLPHDEHVLAIVDGKAKSEKTELAVKDDFFIHTPRKSIDEMLQCSEVERCIVMCTIADIESDMGWYYLSCKVCARKVRYEPTIELGDNDDDLTSFKVYCPKCKVYSPKLLPRYKLHLVVLDNTGTAKFLLFDHLAVQLVHRPCTDLTGPVTDEVQDPGVLPQPILDLVGKTFLFKVEILRENVVYKHDTYKVNKIITNLDIINEFNTPISPTVTSSQSTHHENSFVSDAPEGSLLLEDLSEQPDEATEITPAKRRGGPVVNLEEDFDQNSVTKMIPNSRIKKEKFDESG